MYIITVLKSPKGGYGVSTNTLENAIRKPYTLSDRCHIYTGNKHTNCSSGILILVSYFQYTNALKQSADIFAWHNNSGIVIRVFNDVNLMYCYRVHIYEGGN